MINNSVLGISGKVVGYRCLTCGHVVSSMWGNTCNECRSKSEEGEKLLKAIKEATDKLLNCGK